MLMALGATFKDDPATGELMVMEFAKDVAGARMSKIAVNVETSAALRICLPFPASIRSNSLTSLQ